MRIWGAIFAAMLLTALGAEALYAQSSVGGQSSNDAPLRAPQNLSEPEPLGDIFEDPRGYEQPQPMQQSPSGGDLLLREQSGSRTDIPNAIPPSTAIGLQPFGSQIFTNSGLVDRSVGVNPDYRVAQGDRIAVRMWGARTFDSILVVDIQGNIFLPEIGPVQVEGITNPQLAQRVAIKRRQCLHRQCEGPHKSARHTATWCFRNWLRPVSGPLSGFERR